MCTYIYIYRDIDIDIDIRYRYRYTMTIIYCIHIYIYTYIILWLSNAVIYIYIHNVYIYTYIILWLLYTVIYIIYIYICVCVCVFPVSTVGRGVPWPWVGRGPGSWNMYTHIIPTMIIPNILPSNNGKANILSVFFSNQHITWKRRISHGSGNFFVPKSVRKPTCPLLSSPSAGNVFHHLWFGWWGKWLFCPVRIDLRYEYAMDIQPTIIVPRRTEKVDFSKKIKKQKHNQKPNHQEKQLDRKSHQKNQEKIHCMFLSFCCFLFFCFFCLFLLPACCFFLCVSCFFLGFGFLVCFFLFALVLF